MNDKSNTPPDGWKVVSKENRHSMLAYQCRSKHCGTPWTTTRKGAIEVAHIAIAHARATDPEKAELRELSTALFMELNECLDSHGDPYLVSKRAHDLLRKTGIIK